ncbi:hypothetical protein M747DRAFT_38581 [Aspergillus niger ATCC 13496]|uniref:Uncharacterized protein n=1 Tax=Aspergillus niger ATCC 13496 TaxID=1353008 RepID=A0A370C161_ASPNG|nr:hypothetical protein M747DRAFT_38581 [Aspergillus niger ATCC 13496]
MHAARQEGSGIGGAPRPPGRRKVTGKRREASQSISQSVNHHRPESTPGKLNPGTGEPRKSFRNFLFFFAFSIIFISFFINASAFL